MNNTTRTADDLLAMSRAANTEKMEEITDMLDAAGLRVDSEHSVLDLVAALIECRAAMFKYGGHVESECKTAHDGSVCTCGWQSAVVSGQ